jgi:endo-1,4-beta-D-glucanase Y
VVSSLRYDPACSLCLDSSTALPEFISRRVRHGTWLVFLLCGVAACNAGAPAQYIGAEGDNSSSTGESSSVTTGQAPTSDLSPTETASATAVTSSSEQSTSTGVSSFESSSVDQTSSASDSTLTEEPELRGPTPKTANANFPFPQNREGTYCKLPGRYKNSDVVAAFEAWKAATVTSEGASGHLRVKRLDSDPKLELGSTVSEGIAYGMMIAVYMNEQTMFEEFWKYSQLYLTGNGLMHWYVSANGESVLGEGAASDADEDIAWALIMADRQWGGAGTLDKPYIELAKEQITRIWDHEVLKAEDTGGRLLRVGDSWGNNWETVNISYFAPSYYRTFATVTGNDEWNDVVQTSYDTMNNSLNAENGNELNGLVPAWSTSAGAPNGGVWGGDPAPTHYQYDSCRTPFRVGLDYCFHGEPLAKEYTAKTSAFFSLIGVHAIVDGYELDGTPRPEFPDGQSAAFIGPAAVGALNDPQFSPFSDEAYTALAGLKLLTGGAYYELSWTVLSLLVLSGNFLDYTQLEPIE